MFDIFKIGFITITFLDFIDIAIVSFYYHIKFLKYNCCTDFCWINVNFISCTYS